MECIVGLGAFQPEGGIGRVGQKSLYVFIRMHFYSILPQVGFHFSIHLGRLDEEVGFFWFYEQVADDHRIAMYVRSAEVECPGYLVQGGEQQGIGAGFLHPLADEAQFLFATFSRVCQGMDECFSLRQGRPVRPNPLKGPGDVLQAD